MAKDKTISPQKWDTVKGLMHEAWKNPDSPDGTFIILDDNDLKRLKKVGSLKFSLDDKVEGVSIVYARKKKTPAKRL